MGRTIASAGLVLCLLAGLVVASIQWWHWKDDQVAHTRADAAVAVHALRAGNLDTLGNYLAAYRGDQDFAYYFASETDPRTLGDALGTVATDFNGTEFVPGFDRTAYEFLVPDLAGALSLAMSSTDRWPLAQMWTHEFVTATTHPTSLGTGGEEADDDARAAQDVANKQNLLLLLANGHWPTAFLKTVTTAYVSFDTAEGDHAWPGPQTKGGQYAPAPSGVYLTDGIVALTAALTSNPDASAWAFTDFQPGTKQIDGSDYEIGNFTHYLMFDHQHPKGTDGTDLGVTVSMTALASAAGKAAVDGLTADEPGPVHDAETLTAFANDIKESKRPSCSWRVYDCVVTAAKAVAHLAKWVWEHVSHWGHLVLDAVATVAFVAGAITTGTGVGAEVGVPLMFIGVSAEVANAGWYAVEGDYLMAGISLASVVPQMWFAKLAAVAKGTKVGAAITGAVTAAKGATVGRVLEAAAPLAERVAKVVNVWRKANSFVPATARELAEAGATQVRKAARAVYPKERDYQDDVLASIPGSRKQRLETGCKKTCSGNRDVDVFDPATGACIEVKSGLVPSNKKHDLEEIEKDLLLLKNKNCRSVEWRFGPGPDGKVGPYDALRQALQKKGIKYSMDVPA
ncbi:hypothetical protein GCM10028801_28560 [Nocardioides maradonensis]